jgi:hypothetical protein
MFCPVCEEEKHTYLFVIHGMPVKQCAGCGLISVYPYPDREDVLDFYDVDGKYNPFTSWTDSQTEGEAASHYLAILKKRCPTVRTVLLVSPPNHCFATLARQQDLVVTNLTCQDFEVCESSLELQDAIILLYQLEKACSPRTILDRAFALLRPGGVLLVITPTLSSASAQFFNYAWIGWRPENHYYFDNITLQSLLWSQGFEEVELEKDLRSYTLEHIHDRAAHFPKTWITHLIMLAYRLLPGFLRNQRILLPSSGIIASAHKGERHSLPHLSIILPVFNEARTFPILMEQLLSLKVEGISREIIIVESNSTDSTRQLVLQYQDHPEVKIVLQDRPKGKGNAVREGFMHASGDIVLIQDADLEYDLNDYPALLEPVISFRKPFILGNRHGSTLKMRQFKNQGTLSLYFNLGHIFFTTLINVLYGQHLKDPFTMYKIFRRDCLHNLKLECNRFDFDYELVIKLLRKGYKPLEIPVNYHSRSLEEGKKVTMFRDPLTWIKALFKYRFVNIAKDK